MGLLDPKYWFLKYQSPSLNTKVLVTDIYVELNFSLITKWGIRFLTCTDPKVVPSRYITFSLYTMGSGYHDLRMPAYFQTGQIDIFEVLKSNIIEHADLPMFRDVEHVVLSGIGFKRVPELGTLLSHLSST